VQRRHEKTTKGSGEQSCKNFRGKGIRKKKKSRLPKGRGHQRSNPKETGGGDKLGKSWKRENNTKEKRMTGMPVAKKNGGYHLQAKGGGKTFGCRDGGVGRERPKRGKCRMAPQIVGEGRGSVKTQGDTGEPHEETWGYETTTSGVGDREVGRSQTGEVVKRTEFEGT